MVVKKKVKLSEGEALKNKNSKSTDDKIQVWIPKSTIAYEEEKLKLQIELLKLQTHVRKTGQRIVMLFEGRDAAGKGGTIKRIREHLNPRGARVVALEKPSDTEKTQWYFQRYTDHLPSAGEIVLFDRSWYNRSMVEPVMGFCTDEQHKRFLKYAPVFERILIKEGLILFKLYFSVSKKMQLKRFQKRSKDPLKQYKLSPVDMQAQDLWAEYTMRKFQMLLETNTSLSPWTIIRSDNKKKARINCMKYILSMLDYEGKVKDAALAPDSKIVISGIDELKLMEDNLSKPNKLPG